MIDYTPSPDEAMPDESFELRRGKYGLPPVKVIEWFDRELRQMVLDGQARRFRRVSDVDLHESWSKLLLHIYTDNVLGKRWGNRGHAIAWAFTMTGQHLRNVQWNNSRRYVQIDNARYSISCISQLAQEALEELMTVASKERAVHRADLGPAAEGWLSAALDDLTPNQRHVVELCIVGGYTQTEAAGMINRSVSTVSNAKTSAMAKLTMAAFRHTVDPAAAKLAAEGVPYRMVHGHPVELAG